VRQNAEFLRIMDQLDNEDVLAAEPGALDGASWPEHDTPLFPLVVEESELDSYWTAFDPFDAAAAEDQVADRLSGQHLKRLPSPSPPPHQCQQQQQQPVVLNPGRKRPRDCGTSPALLQRDVTAEQAQDGARLSSSSPGDARTTPVAMSVDNRQPTAADVVVDATAASSDSSLGIPLGGLLSSLPPNCSVYITHRPASTSPSPVTQIIINRARPPPPPPSLSPPYCMPSLLPLPTLPPSPLSTTVDQFHPLDDARLRKPAAVPSAPLTSVVRPPKSLSTYAAEFHRRAVGDAGTWRYDAGRRASDSTAAENFVSSDVDARPANIADRCRHRSSKFLPSTSSPLPQASANRFQRPTTLSLSTAVFGPQLRHSVVATASSASPSGRRQRDDATDCGVAVSRTCLEEPRGYDSGKDGAAACLLLSDVVPRHVGSSSSSSSSSSPSSLIDVADGHVDLALPLLSTDPSATSPASAKPQQRTIDALSRKIQRNQTKKSDRPTIKDSPATSFPKPDSSCPSPPLSRQLTPTSAFSSASLPPFDVSEQSDKSCSQRGVLLDEDVVNATSISTTDDASNGVLVKEPSTRKRSARRKSHTPRQMSANDIDKVIITTP